MHKLEAANGLFLFWSLFLSTPARCCRGFVCAIWSWIPPKYEHCGQGFVSTTCKKAYSTTCCWQLMYRINQSKPIQSLFPSHSAYLLAGKFYLIFLSGKFYLIFLPCIFDLGAVHSPLQCLLRCKWVATAWILQTMDWCTSQNSTTNCMEDVFSTAVTTLYLRFCGMSTMFIFIFQETGILRQSLASRRNWMLIFGSNINWNLQAADG